MSKQSRSAVKTGTFPVCTIIFIFLFSSIAFAAKTPSIKTVDVMGTGKIIENDEAKARDEAISAGLVSAMEHAFIEIAPLSSLVYNFSLINEILSTGRNDLIEGFRVLAETKNDSDYRVLVEASVNMKKAEAKLSKSGIILKKTTLPRILLIISEKDLNDLTPRYWWGDMGLNAPVHAETEMISFLAKQGYPVVPHPSYIPAGSVPETAGSAFASEFYIDRETAVKLGLRLSADVIIVGKAVARRGKNKMGEDLRSYEAVFDGVALKTDTGEEIIRVSRPVVEIQVNDAEGGRKSIASASYAAAETISRKVTAEWQNQTRKLSVINLTLEGRNYLSEFVILRKALAEISGVKSFKSKEMTAGGVILEVTYSGSVKNLADSLARQNYGDFGINIVKISDNSLRIKLESGLEESYLEN